MGGRRKSKSSEISERLKSEILSGRFDGTRMLPSEHQLMRRFSVARETVRAALKDLFDRRLIDRKPGYGTFLAEHAEASAARKLAIVMPDAYYPFYAKIAHGAESAARRAGWTTFAASLGSGSMRERAVKAAEFAEVCVREKTGGVLFQPLQFLKGGERFNRAILGVFDSARIPVTLVDSDIVAPPLRSEYDLVGVDSTNAGYVLARHVIARGAKRIRYFSNPMPAPTSLNRANGVGIAVGEAGLRWTRDSVFFGDPADARAVSRLFSGKDRPDAVIAVNDYVAATLLKTLRGAGLRVPDDVLLAGCNGDPASEESDPPITTAVQPCHEIGEAAVALLLRRINDPRCPATEVLFGARLEARASTGR